MYRVHVYICIYVYRYVHIMICKIALTSYVAFGSVDRCGMLISSILLST